MGKNPPEFVALSMGKMIETMMNNMGFRASNMFQLLTQLQMVDGSAGKPRCSTRLNVSSSAPRLVIKYWEMLVGRHQYEATCPPPRVGLLIGFPFSSMGTCPRD